LNSNLTTIEKEIAEAEKAAREKEETTMALTVTKMTRVFQFQRIRLPDPNPEMSVEEVKALDAAQYPELATAVVNGPEAAGDRMRHTFERPIVRKV
jgi:PRTRC genetic system protein C